MAFLTLANTSEPLDLLSEDFVKFSTFISGTATQWSWISAAGHRIDVFGTGFTYSSGRAITGTAEEIVFDIDNDGQGALEVLASGLNFAASNLDDGRESFWRILDGNDTVTGPRLANLSSVGLSRFFGDGVVASSSGSGGIDIIAGGDAPAEIYGDVSILGIFATEITYFGGDDELSNQFTVHGATFVGDTGSVSPWSNLIGGDDKITTRSTNTVSKLYGDTIVIFGVSGISGEVTGGNDTLDASSIFVGIDVGVELYGDVGTSQFGTIIGGNDKLLGSNYNDVLVGDVKDGTGNATGGNDEMYGNGGNDRMYGDAQSLYINRGGNDVMFGGDGDDLMIGEFLPDLAGFNPLGGDDKMYGGAGADELIGQSGNDLLDGGLDIDLMTGGIGNDLYYVENALDVVRESAGEGTADRVLTSVSYTLAVNQHIELFSTTFSPGSDAINLTGNNLSNTILGNNGVNVLNGGAGIDRMTGLNGSDLYVVDNFLDAVIEGAGGGTQDRVATSVNYALADNQQIELFSTTDTTGTAAISMVGNNLANRILGNNGVNVINGGLGNDFITGGLGADKFRFATAIAGGSNVDTIADFVHLIDDFQLAQGVFTNIGGGLDAAEFRLGTSANTAAHRIIYDGVTGNLFFDADGTGAAAQVQFAKVTASTVLDINDFIMI